MKIVSHPIYGEGRLIGPNAYVAEDFSIVEFFRPTRIGVQRLTVGNRVLTLIEEREDPALDLSLDIDLII